MNGIIYMATSQTTGKAYIGQTSRLLDKRKMGHRCDARLQRNNMPFHRAIRKHGWNDFHWEILAECRLYALDYYERRFIEMYDTYYTGYNATPGGNVSRGKDHPMYGRNHTKESKQKMSKKLRGNNALKRKRTEETKRKMSESKLGKNNPMFGKALSKEHKDKISKALVGKNKSQKTKNNMRKAWVLRREKNT